jgi:hypothetical protein
MKPVLNQPDTIKIRWVYDLSEPPRPGKWVTRNGHQVDVTAHNLKIAQARLVAGAMDVLFIAERVFPNSGEPYYELKTFEIIT